MQCLHLASKQLHITRLQTASGVAVGELLVAEYTKNAEAIGCQLPEGEAGHFNACYTHKVTKAEASVIKRGV